MIWIRADANSEIGTGHVMRCLSIAAAIKKCGQEICFILADEFPLTLLQDRGMHYRVLHTSYDKTDEELPLLCKWLSEDKPQLLLIDSYYVSGEYIAKAGKLVKTAYIDDMFFPSCPADILINYNIYGDMLPYREVANARTALLLGTAYAPLREEFCDVKYSLQEEVKHVLITTGGSDKYNLAGRIVEAALQKAVTGKLHYHIVSGIFNQHYPCLKKLEQEHGNIHIHQNVTNMAELMQACDVAITAGGSTMYELCAVGLPMICFSFADNQKKQVETFAGREIVCFGGDYELQEEKMLEEVIVHLGKLAKSWEARKAYSQRGKAIVDGRGAERIAKILCKTK